MSEISQVAIIPCASYDPVLVNRAVSAGLVCLGGLESLVRQEERILLKPNLLKKADPVQAITTHPAVFSAVARSLKEYGCRKITYGDSPGMQSFTDAAGASGMARAAQELEIMSGDFSESCLLSYPEGRTAQIFTVSRAVTDADCLINICKMKTHALERITGAVKNIYGCVHGTHKSAGHVRYPSAQHFASMLCDLHGAVKPRLHIMDGIVAMEGNGPASGTPVSMKVLLFSTDPVALDTVFCHLVHLDPALVPTNFCGEQYGIGTMKTENIRLLTINDTDRQETGDALVRQISLEDAVVRWGNPDFDVDRNPVSERRMWKLLRRVMKPLQQRPEIHKDRCVRCGICVESCPVEGKAVTFKNGRDRPPVYDYSKCIRCYCCQEMCPKKAIEVRTPWISRLIR